MAQLNVSATTGTGSVVNYITNTNMTVVPTNASGVYNGTIENLENTNLLAAATLTVEPGSTLACSMIYSRHFNTAGTLNVIQPNATVQLDVGSGAPRSQTYRSGTWNATDGTIKFIGTTRTVWPTNNFRVGGSDPLQMNLTNTDFIGLDDSQPNNLIIHTRGLQSGDNIIFSGTNFTRNVIIQTALLFDFVNVNFASPGSGDSYDWRGVQFLDGSDQSDWVAFIGGNIPAPNGAFEINSGTGAGGYNTSATNQKEILFIGPTNQFGVNTTALRGGQFVRARRMFGWNPRFRDVDNTSFFLDDIRLTFPDITTDQAVFIPTPVKTSLITAETSTATGSVIHEGDLEIVNDPSTQRTTAGTTALNSQTLATTIALGGAPAAGFRLIATLGSAFAVGDAVRVPYLTVTGGFGTTTATLDGPISTLGAAAGTAGTTIQLTVVRTGQQGYWYQTDFTTGNLTDSTMLGPTITLNHSTTRNVDVRSYTHNPASTTIQTTSHGQSDLNVFSEDQFFDYASDPWIDDQLTTLSGATIENTTLDSYQNIYKHLKEFQYRNRTPQPWTQDGTRFVFNDNVSVGLGAATAISSTSVTVNAGTTVGSNSVVNEIEVGGTSNIAVGTRTLTAGTIRHTGTGQINVTGSTLNGVTLGTTVNSSVTGLNVTTTAGTANIEGGSVINLGGLAAGTYDVSSNWLGLTSVGTGNINIISTNPGITLNGVPPGFFGSTNVTVTPRPTFYPVSFNLLDGENGRIIIRNTSDNTNAFVGNITRASGVTTITRISGLALTNGLPEFSDIDTDNYTVYYKLDSSVDNAATTQPENVLIYRTTARTFSRLRAPLVVEPTAVNNILVGSSSFNATVGLAGAVNGTNTARYDLTWSGTTRNNPASAGVTQGEIAIALNADSYIDWIASNELIDDPVDYQLAGVIWNNDAGIFGSDIGANDGVYNISANNTTINWISNASSTSNPVSGRVEFKSAPVMGVAGVEQVNSIDEGDASLATINRALAGTLGAAIDTSTTANLVSTISTVTTDTQSIANAINTDLATTRLTLDTAMNHVTDAKNGVGFLVGNRLGNKGAAPFVKPMGTDRTATTYYRYDDNLETDS